MTDPRADPTVIDVVAAVIRRNDRLLVGLRPARKRHGGRWEFPGGKLLEGESFLAAATRELREELELEVAAVGSVRFRTRDPGSPFLIHFVPVDVRGTPRPVEHVELAWCDEDALARLDLAPADARFVRSLREER